MGEEGGQGQDNSQSVPESTQTPDQERVELVGRLNAENSKLQGKLLTTIRMRDNRFVLVFNGVPKDRSPNSLGRYGVHPDLGPVEVSPVLLDSLTEDTSEDSFENRLETHDDYPNVMPLVNRVSEEIQYAEWNAARRISVVMAEKAIEDDAKKYTTKALQEVKESQHTEAAHDNLAIPTETGAQIGVAHAVVEDSARMDKDSADRAALDAQNTLGHSQ